MASMSFRSIVQDVRDGFGSLSRRGFEVLLSGYSWRKSHNDVDESNSGSLVTQHSCWANLPVELLREIIKRLDEDENLWPERKNVVSCASVCRSWRDICMEVVKNPEWSGKLTFPISLKQPGPREGHIQCFIRRDESNSTYYLYLCLNTALFVERGKFLLSAKRIRRTTYTEYIISMHPNKISKSSHGYIGKLRSNFLGTKFLIYDTQPPYNGTACPPPGRSSRRFYTKKVSPKFASGNFNVAQVTYELNILGNRGPRRMNCTMYSIPASSLEAGGTVPGHPERLFQRSLDDSFRSTTYSESSVEHSSEFRSSRFLEPMSLVPKVGDGVESKDVPLILQNKSPRWHEQLQCWCLNFRGRVTVASVKNFQLIAAAQPGNGSTIQVQPMPTEHDTVILQFGKVGKDMFTMDYRYPLSTFQAFAICLSSFDTKLACE